MENELRNYYVTTKWGYSYGIFSGETELKAKIKAANYWGCTVEELTAKYIPPLPSKEEDEENEY